MKPILFNTEMVRAILDGRKSVTRRVVKAPYYIDDEEASKASGLAIHQGTRETDGMPYPDAPYRPGDILYVREAWAKDPMVNGYAYKAWFDTENGDAEKSDKLFKWRPSIHMPKEAARLFLRVTDVRVERLQDIDNAGARAEGCDGRCEGPEDGALSDCQKQYDFSLEKFQSIWDSNIPKHPNKFKRYLFYWDDNPWVWVIEFERISKEDAQKGGDGK